MVWMWECNIIRLDSKGKYSEITKTQKDCERADMVSNRTRREAYRRDRHLPFSIPWLPRLSTTSSTTPGASQWYVIMRFGSSFFQCRSACGLGTSARS